MRQIFWIGAITMALALPATSFALAVELGGAVGSPAEVAGGDHSTSLGGFGALLFHSSGPVDLGVGVEYNRFDKNNGDGSTSFTSMYLDLRAAFVRKEAFRLFVVFAPGLTGRTISFSESAKASNNLIPPNDSDISFGLGLGTGFSIRLAGDWLRLVSLQKIHLVTTEVKGSTFFTVSLGVALSN